MCKVPCARLARAWRGNGVRGVDNSSATGDFRLLMVFFIDLQCHQRRPTNPCDRVRTRVWRSGRRVQLVPKEVQRWEKSREIELKKPSLVPLGVKKLDPKEVPDGEAQRLGWALKKSRDFSKSQSPKSPDFRIHQAFS